MLYDKVERPTLDQSKATGAAINPDDGHTIVRRPGTFQIMGAGGYFQTKIVRGEC